jgi:hypothetical protein
VKPQGGWTDTTEKAKLTASDGSANDDLGGAVAIKGTTLVAGAPYANTGGQGGQGAAYVYTRPANGWVSSTQTAKLTASDATEGANFGWSVAAAPGTVVVGAPNQNTNQIFGVGAAYVFVEPSTGWTNATQTAELTPSFQMKDSRFGFSVATNGSLVVVGVPGFENFNLHDVAAVFVRRASGWNNMTQSFGLTHPKGSLFQNFGYSVGLGGQGIIVVGAPGSTLNDGTATGYVFGP